MKKRIILILIFLMSLSTYSFNNRISYKIDNLKKIDLISNDEISISEYDSLIKLNSEKIGWDWLLVSSIIYNESRFNHKAISKHGAFGIMQFMPNTAKSYGINRYSPVESQIEAGVKHLDKLDKLLEKHVYDSIERKKFVIASYNSGIGHVYKAIKLTKHNNKNHQKWSIVKNYMSVNHTKIYVSKVFHRYEYYLKLMN